MFFFFFINIQKTMYSAKFYIGIYKVDKKVIVEVSESFESCCGNIENAQVEL